MNINSESNGNNKKDTKAKAAIPMAGAIVTAAILLSGLSLIGGYQQPVIAAQHENMTETGGTTGDGGAMTGGGATEGGNATTTGGAQGNDSMSEVRMHLEEARTAIQNNDTQGALMNLDLAINALGGASGAEMNMTGTTGNMTDTTGNTTGTTGENTGGGAEGETTGGEGGEGGGVLEGIFGGG
jgi:hypothetical protein